MERLQRLAKKLQKNEYEVEICASSKEAVDYLLKRCQNKVVGIGDSHTVKKIGLLESFQKNNIEVHECITDKSKESKLKSIDVDTFILSANAISKETGEIVNVDSSCNRVAGSLFGPDEVIFVVGRNKLANNLSDAIYRARNVAAVENAKVHNYATPCVITGKCEDCDAYDRICRATVIYHKKPKRQKGLVVLINEDLGF